MEKSKILYTTNFTYTFNEYKKAVFATPTKFKRIYDAILPAFCISFGGWLLTFSVWIEFSQIMFRIFPFLALFCFILRTIREYLKALKFYSSNTELQGQELNYNFLSDSVEVRFFSQKHHDKEEKILSYRYNNFVELIETKTNLYLLINDLGEKLMFVLIKENCTSDLVDFVRNLPVKRRC